jgi:hypothetical protein
MLFTRAINLNTREEYLSSLKTAQLALFAAAVLAEDECEDDLSQGRFTMKLHWAIAHLRDMCMLRGHPTFSNDLWVERAVRVPACKESRFGPQTTTLSLVRTLFPS